MTRTPAKAVPAVRRAAAILWLLAEQGDARTLSEVARTLDILPSTALHILRELIAARLVLLDPAGKRYRLGPGLVELARTIPCNDFSEIVRPLLEDIASRFDVTATATVIVDRDHSTCVASVSPPDGTSVHVTVGGRVPRLSGAAGRCVAAYGETPPVAGRPQHDRIRWQTPLGFQTWEAQVAQVRAHGFAEDDGFFARGVTTLAAPVFDPGGGVTKALGVVSISAALDRERRIALAAALAEACRQASHELALASVFHSP